MAFRKNLAAVPVLLTELEGKERSSRKWADDALRALAGVPNGVGYDPDKPDPKLWQEYWAKKEKK